jgi:two-component system NtrC family sensor kinase
MGLFEQLQLILGAVALLVGAAALFRRHSGKALREQLARIEHLASTGAMVAGVVHEVKNPLNGIVGFAQLGQAATEVTDMREYFMLIEQDARRANALLEGLLDFTRPTRVSEFEVLSVTEVVDSALNLVRHQLELFGALVTVTFAQDLPFIRGDANQLRQVLINVLLNAGHALAEAAVRRVTVTVARGRTGVEIVVEDSGPGLSDEAQKHAFTAFFTTKPRGQGTGLGLSVSRQLVEAHGGTLRIDPASRTGARVVMTLPR